MTPYGALQPQPPLSDSSLTRSFSFIIYLVGATYRRWDILCIFKQFTAHELKPKDYNIGMFEDVTQEMLLC